jgi:hypothetical protein
MYVPILGVARLQGPQKSVKVAIKKLLRFSQKTCSTMFWYKNSTYTKSACQKSVTWFRELNVESTEKLFIDCIHGNSETVTNSKQIQASGTDKRVIDKTEKIPVVIFAFNRPNSLKKLIASLQKTERMDNFHYILFLDGPREASDLQWILESRKVFESFKASSKTLFESDHNLGLHNSIKSGLDSVFEVYEFAIVLEDDLECDRTLLDWFAKQGEIQSEISDIGAICGYFPINLRLAKNQVLRMDRFHSWGWATWSNVWENVNFSQENLIRLVLDEKFRRKLFKISPDLLPMIIAQLCGDISSWAIKFIASGVLHNLSYSFPDRTLVLNNGVNEFATHTHQVRANIKSIQIDIDSPTKLARVMRAYYA